MASGGTLEGAFHAFADKGNGSEMSTKAITRWFTDAGILTKKNCTSQNLDIAFSAAKPKGRQFVSMNEIDDVMRRVSDAYAKDHDCSKDEAYKKIKAALRGADKQQHNTTNISATGNVDHFTDSSLYTGSHKSRFDADGKGMGKAGRTDEKQYPGVPDLGKDNPEVDERLAPGGFVQGYKGTGTYDKTHPPPGPAFAQAAADMDASRGAGPSAQPFTHSGYVGGYKGAGTYDQTHGGGAGTPHSKAGEKKSAKADAITDRLTNTEHYTGSHKQRFDASGHGRGIAGRDDVATPSSGYVQGYQNQGSYGGGR